MSRPSRLKSNFPFFIAGIFGMNLKSYLEERAVSFDLHQMMKTLCCALLIFHLLVFHQQFSLTQLLFRADGILYHNWRDYFRRHCVVYNYVQISEGSKNIVTWLLWRSKYNSTRIFGSNIDVCMALEYYFFRLMLVHLKGLWRRAWTTSFRNPAL